MGKLILYGTLLSPPVRATLFTLNALELDFEFIEVDVLKGEQNTEEFIKKNPQHTVPVLDDDGAFISDSHAIIAYLCRKFGKDDSLYPKDFYQRAIVDQRLHFESGILFARCLKGFRTPGEILEQKLKNIEDAYDFLELFLQDAYMAGDHLTIADFSILASVTSLGILIPIDFEKWPKLEAWLELMKELPYYEQCNAEGLKLLKEMITPILLAMANEYRE